MGFFSKIKKFLEAEKTPKEVEKAPKEKTGTAIPEKPETSAESSVSVEAQAASLDQTDQTRQQLTQAVPSAAKSDENWQSNLTLKLREAEPKLSIWLNLTLEGISEAGERLWERVRFLLVALGAPGNEAKLFTDDFARWAEQMEYENLEDFRSELQYRLALALDMEDEEDERNRIFLKLHESLSRTREHFSRGLNTLFADHEQLSENFWEELEELFIMSDMGLDAAQMLCKTLKDQAIIAKAQTPEELRPLLAKEVEKIFRANRRIVAVNPPEVVMMIGVNGVGKTTTIAKLAYRAKMQGKKVLLAAADTFRAAAVEQLQIWAERTGSGFYAKSEGADPAAVAWEAMDIAIKEKYDILFVDTAGRLHTKSNLMDELHKIREVLSKKHQGAPHRSVLIIDATTGQNALQQVKIFKESAGIDEIILTKLDGTAKGGVSLAIAMQYKIPITFVGLGEKMEDLRPFEGEDFAKALVNSSPTSRGLEKSPD